jgi:hypothetical protein
LIIKGAFTFVSFLKFEKSLDEVRNTCFGYSQVFIVAKNNGYNMALIWPGPQAYEDSEKCSLPCTLNPGESG